MHTFRDQEVVCSFWIIQPHSWFCTSFKHTIIISPSIIWLLHAWAAWHCSMIGITCMFVDLSVMRLLLAEAKNVTVNLLWLVFHGAELVRLWSQQWEGLQLNVSSTSGQNLFPSNSPETRKCNLDLPVNLMLEKYDWLQHRSHNNDVVVCVHVCVCACGGQFRSQCLLVVTPGQSLHCNVWLKLIAPTLLELLDIESRVPSDGIAQFLPGVFSCRGFAHLSGWKTFRCT